MPTPLSVVQDEFQVYVKQEVEKTKPSLASHLPPPGLAELTGNYAVDTEKFWEQKHASYFPRAIKPENESFETSFQKNLEKLVATVSRSWGALRHAGDDARNNLEVVKIAVVQDGWALQYAGADAKNNPEVVKIAVAQDGWALEYAGADAINNPQVVKIAVSRNGWALGYANERLRDDPEIVRLAVAQNAFALQYAGPNVKNNPVIIAAAIKNDPDAIRFAGYKFSSNRELLNASFCLQALFSAALVGGGIALIVTAISLTAGIGLIAAGVTAGTFFACRKFNTRKAFQEAEKNDAGELVSAENLTPNFGT